MAVLASRPRSDLARASIASLATSKMLSSEKRCKSSLLKSCVVKSSSYSSSADQLPVAGVVACLVVVLRCNHAQHAITDLDQQ